MTKAEAEKLTAIDGKIDQVLSILMGDPNNPEKPGLVERIRIVEKWQAGERWALLVLAALFLADLGASLLDLWKAHP